MPRRRFRLLATALVTAVQLPTLAALTWLTRTPAPVPAGALLSWPYLRQLQSPWHSEGGRLSMRVALGWWSACLVFDLLLVPVLLALHCGAPPLATWLIAGVLALALGADAVIGGPRLRRVQVRIPELPPELDGYRIGHLSDIHCGPHVSEARVRRWVKRLNAQRLDLAAVTGDLIAHGPSHVDAVARALGELRARDGVFASMGNHDYFTDGETLIRALRRHGIPVLRNAGVSIARGSARLYVAGADDTWTERDDVPRALAERPHGAPAVLLAHDPDLFPEAAARGVDLTLSGHTHGGQLGVPGLPRFSLARVVTRWTAGLFRSGRSWLYVSRGAGTTGPPARLGAPAELTVLTLRRA